MNDAWPAEEREPREVARAETERGELVLRRRADGALELRVNGVFVMDTEHTQSERLLAAAALARVAEPRAVLVAGLGLGFTVHEVLADRRVQDLRVVEIEDTLVGWLRDGTVPHGPALLADERVTVVVADVQQAVAEARPATYDLVLLDVDNGPDQLVLDSNAEVYGPTFLGRLARMLRPGGVLAVWSAQESEDLATRLRETLGEVEALPQEVSLQSRPERYWVYLATRPSPDSSAV